MSKIKRHAVDKVLNYDNSNYYRAAFRSFNSVKLSQRISSGWGGLYVKKGIADAGLKITW